MSEHIYTLTRSRLDVWVFCLLKNNTLHGPTCCFHTLIIQNRWSTNSALQQHATSHTQSQWENNHNPKDLFRKEKNVIMPTFSQFLGHKPATSLLSTLLFSFLLLFDSYVFQIVIDSITVLVLIYSTIVTCYPFHIWGRESFL